MVWGSRPCSCTSRRTAGDKAAVAVGAAAGAAGGAAKGAAKGAATGSVIGGAAAGVAAMGAGAAAVWVSSSRQSKPPTARVVSSGAMISLKTPALGAGISTATLSVSNSTSGSSWAIASPTPFSQRPTVASVTDSPNTGTKISIIGGPSSRLMRSKSQRLGYQAGLFFVMCRHAADRRRSAFRPPDVF